VCVIISLCVFVWLTFTDTFSSLSACRGRLGDGKGVRIVNNLLQHFPKIWGPGLTWSNSGKLDCKTKIDSGRMSRPGW